MHRVQRIIVHCKHVSGHLCAAHEERSGGIGPEVSSHVSWVWLHLALQIQWVWWSEPSLTQAQVIVGGERRNFYGFEIQVCHSGMARSGVKPPAKRICITRGLSMRSVLYHGSASCCVFWWALKQLARVWFLQAYLSLLDSRSNQKYTKRWISERFGWQSTRSFGLDEFEDMMQELAPASVSGVGQTRDKADRKMAVFLTHTRSHQAARTQIQGGWRKSWAPSRVPSRVQKNLRVPSLAWKVPVLEICLVGYM